MPLLDTDLILRNFLKARAPIGTVEARQMFASTDLPEGYEPGQNGPAHLFSVRGQGEQDYSNQVQTRSYQFSTYAVSEREARAEALALYDILNDAKTYHILASRMEGAPSPLNDPETEWPYVLSFYSIQFLNV